MLPFVRRSLTRSAAIPKQTWMNTDFRSLRGAVALSALIAAVAFALAFERSPQNAQKLSAPELPSVKSSKENVSLPGGSFEPLTSPPAGTVSGGEAASSGDGEGYYIVQFARTADDAMLDRLRESGVEVLQYVPNRAFYVYARGGAAAMAAGNADVRWVGRLLPEHKIPATLTAQLEAARYRSALPEGFSPIRMSRKGTAAFDAAVFKRADLKAAAERIAANAGGRVRELIELPGNFFNIVRIEAPLGTATLAAEVEEVFRIDAWSPPTREDERAAQIVAGNYTSRTAIDAPGYDPLAQFGVDGTGVTVSVVDDGVGIPGDGGFYVTASNAANAPLRGAPAGAAGHGHLNASIIAGTTPFSSLDPGGYNYGLGVAPKSNILNVAFLRSGYTGTEAATANDTVANAGPNGVPGSISNNSWGSGTNGNAYDSYAAQFDGFVRDASAAASIDPLLIVFSAGNSGASGLTRPKMSKNTIAVANLENLRTGSPYNSDNIDDLGGSSSIGPGADGRVKPDIAAPGTAIAGGRSGSDPLFGNIDANHRWSSGTSHAAPQAAGAAALFTQFWKAGNAGANPSPALVKAALINGAVDVNGVSTAAAAPNGSEGWGRVNLKNVLNTGAAITYVNETHVLTGTGNSKTYNGTIADAARPLRVTLVWTDPPAAGDPALVNDLNLEVTVGGTTYRGNLLSNGISVAGGTTDSINNVENVFLPPGRSGPLSIKVTGGAINGDGVIGNADATDQHFALVVANGSVSAVPAAALVPQPANVITGDSVIEPNECNRLDVPFTNAGDAAATGVTAMLSTTTPGVSVTVANAAYPNIAAGATAQNLTSFQVSTDNTLACLTNADFTLTVNFAGGASPAVYNFSLPVGQPGGSNYSFASSSGAAISPGGSLVAGSTADDAVVDLAAPFAFSVYGTGVAAGTNIRLGTNGFIRIEPAGSTLAAAGNVALPSSGSGSFPANLPVLMPYWDDLDMTPAVTAGGGIYTEVTGSPGSRTLKIEWRARRWVAGQPLGAVDTNFAVYFHEGSGNFEYVYALTGTGPNAGGASATVGVQAAAAGSVFTQYSSGTASLSAGQMLSAAIAPPACTPGNGACILTSAPVAVAGRAVTPEGRGIRGVRVTLVDEAGQERLATTNSFGYFRFDGVQSGRAYVISAAARGYRFQGRLLELNESVGDLTFAATRW